jgi:hypothetical protein
LYPPSSSRSLCSCGATRVVLGLRGRDLPRRLRVVRDGITSFEMEGSVSLCLRVVRDGGCRFISLSPRHPLVVVVGRLPSTLASCLHCRALVFVVGFLPSSSGSCLRRRVRAFVVGFLPSSSGSCLRRQALAFIVEMSPSSSRSCLRNLHAAHKPSLVSCRRRLQALAFVVVFVVIKLSSPSLRSYRHGGPVLAVVVDLSSSFLSIQVFTPRTAGIPGLEYPLLFAGGGWTGLVCRSVVEMK